MNRRTGVLLIAVAALVFSLAGLVVGQYVKLPLLNAETPVQPGGSVGSGYSIILNPVVINPLAKTLSVVRWKENITKANPYVCPAGYAPDAGAMFLGSGTASDPYYLNVTVNSVVRDGQPYNLTQKGPMDEWPSNLNEMITLSSDLIALNPRVSTEFPGLIIADLSRVTNTIMPKHYYVGSYTNSYLKESEVIGAKITKTAYRNDPGWWALCIKGGVTN